MVASCSRSRCPDQGSVLGSSCGRAADLTDWDQDVAVNNASEEEQTCLYLTKLFENSLSRAKESKLHCSEVLVPERLIRKIARDVLCLSSSEPCGLRGSIIYINMEIESMCKKLDRIVYDSSVVPTFELTLILKQDGSSWPSLRDFFFIGTCFAPGFRQALKLSPGFCLIKKKLYSSSAGTVIEC